jgi:hypothetical protein
MDIYIIHEFDIVKIIYGKNIVSHHFNELTSFTPSALGLTLARHQVGPYLRLGAKPGAIKDDSQGLHAIILVAEVTRLQRGVIA